MVCDQSGSEFAALPSALFLQNSMEVVVGISASLYNVCFSSNFAIFFCIVLLWGVHCKAQGGDLQGPSAVDKLLPLLKKRIRSGREKEEEGGKRREERGKGE